MRQFVQSDRFLPVFISHDKDTAWNVCTTHAPGWIDPLECRDLFLSWIDSSVIIYHFWSHFAYLNQGIVFKACLVCTACTYVLLTELKNPHSTSFIILFMRVNANHSKSTKFNFIKLLQRFSWLDQSTTARLITFKKKGNRIFLKHAPYYTVKTFILLIIARRYTFALKRDLCFKMLSFIIWPRASVNKKMKGKYQQAKEHSCCTNVTLHEMEVLSNSSQRKLLYFFVNPSLLQWKHGL